MENEKMAFFAFSFILLAIGGPCGFVDSLSRGSNATANQTVATHLACQNNACVPVSGGGPGACATDSDCAPAPAGNQSGSQPATHLACVNNKCANVSGAGSNGCSADSDCASPVTHLACVNSACKSVSGAGSNSCTTDSDCAPAPTGGQTGGSASAFSQYADCSACLKTVPNQCKWCIQGSICTGANDNTQSCTFGPTAEKWLTKDYQCVLATR